MGDDEDIHAAATARRLEQAALVDFSRLDREIAVLVADRAIVADTLMTLRFARWRLVIAREKEPRRVA